MLVNESAWIGRILDELDVNALSPLINLGSATHEFRTQIQPHIHNQIIKPLIERNVQVIHADLFAGKGVDVAGSIYDASVFDSLVNYKPKAVLCSNVFEHVPDRTQLAARLTHMLPVGGILIVTVPYRFPYHPDPIDTGFRPTPEELCKLLPAFDMIRGDIIQCGTLIGRYRRSKKFMLHHMVGSVVPIPFGRWVRNLHHWLWLTRQYEVSCAVFRKRSNSG